MMSRKSQVLAFTLMAVVTACSESVQQGALSWKLVSPSQGGTTVSSPTTSVDTDGNILLTWLETETREADGNADILCTRANLLTRHYNNGSGTWGNTANLQSGVWRRTSTKDTNDGTWRTLSNVLASQLQLGADGNGNHIAVWLQDTVSDCDAAATKIVSIYQSIYSAENNTWSTPALLVDTPTQNASNPSLAVSALGTALATWQENDSSGLVTLSYASHFDSVDTWGAPIIVSGDDGGTPLGYYSSHAPKAALDSSDNGAVIWRQNGNGIFEIFGRNYSAADGWSATPVKLSNSSVDATDLNIASNSTSIWAAWVELDANGAGQIIVNNLNTDSTSGTSTAVKGDLAATEADEREQHATSPKLVVDGSGNVTIAWLQRQNYDPLSNRWNNNSAVAIWSNRYSGGSWSGGSPVLFQQRLSAESVSVSLKGSDPVISWIQNNDALESHPQAIVSSRYTGGKWSDFIEVAEINEASTQLHSKHSGDHVVDSWIRLDTESATGQQKARIEVAHTY
ncbi:MAG: hypothetical protein OEZ43_00885 [Gammaproteobacteria bacterium]|nr:hypothetical protein [Gammaproteobacteria bacterium]